VSRFVARAIWGAWFGASFLFASHPTPIRQFGVFLAAIVLLGLVLGSAAWLPISWLRGQRPAWRLPLLSAAWLVVGAAGSIAVGFAVRTWTFRHDLPRYEKAAAWVRDKEVGGWNIELPPEWSDLAHRVWARRNDECGLRIYFHWGGGFPVKHTARVYAPSVSLLDKPACHIGRWPHAQQLANDWYEVSD
jgi:hypothetical protein